MRPLTVNLGNNPELSLLGNLKNQGDNRRTLVHNLSLFITLNPTKGAIIINKGISRELNLTSNYFVTVEELFGKIYIKFTRKKESEDQFKLRISSSADIFTFSNRKIYNRILELYKVKTISGMIGYNFNIQLVSSKEFMIKCQREK